MRHTGKNLKQDIAIYNQICDHYLKIVSELIPQLGVYGMRVETVKQEKASFRASLRKDVVRFKIDLLRAVDDLNLEDRRFRVSHGSFEATFTTLKLFEVKTRFEKLITRKHHRWYLEYLE